MECHSEPDLTKITESGEEISMYVDSTKFAVSIHGEFACVDCHFDAEEIPHAETLAPVDCGMCHDGAAEDFGKSIHAEARTENDLPFVSCTDCHGKHDILPSANPASRVHPLRLARTCAVCHADPQVVKKYNIPIANPLAAYENSVHGVAVMSEQNYDAATCASCHESHKTRPMDDPDSPIFWTNVPETCGQCHGEIYEQYVESVHGVAAAKGVRDAPVCTDCHGEHQVRSPEDPKSPVHPLRVAAETCERCHGSELITGRYGLAESRVETFEESFHGLAIRGGSLSAANCASCHGIHNILPSSDPKSLVNPANLRKTCGSCHPDFTENVARGSVHLTTSTAPGRIVQLVKSVYIWLIVIVIGGMILHNSADFINKAKRKVRQREEA